MQTMFRFASQMSGCSVAVGSCLHCKRSPLLKSVNECFRCSEAIEGCEVCSEESNECYACALGYSRYNHSLCVRCRETIPHCRIWSQTEFRCVLCDDGFSLRLPECVILKIYDVAVCFRGS